MTSHSSYKLTRNRGHSISSWFKTHIMQAMNKAIDEVRAEEARQLKRDGYEPILKRARWCLLKRPENLTSRR
jgi:transposase